MRPKQNKTKNRYQKTMIPSTIKTVEEERKKISENYADYDDDDDGINGQK